jgi:hypothetical protein
MTPQRRSSQGRQDLRAVRVTSMVVIILITQNVCSRKLAAQSVDFEKQIAPLFVAHCLECHRGEEPEGELNLAVAEMFRKGGASGEPTVAGSAEKSLLWERVSRDEMPPEHPLSLEQKELLKAWIDEGAKWSGGSLDLFAYTTSTRGGRDWWSFQPLTKESAPPTDPSWGRNPIDAFVWLRLREAKLEPSPIADPRSLIRRLYFDLTGLPPTPEEVAAFVADPSDAAYERLVDRLLMSPHYGERWGRHWLDIVRFGESDGYERNFVRENAWHYRDWVIGALNADMPYDEFVRMQLIGDQLTDDQSVAAAATGFWVAGVHNTVVGGSKRMQQLARQDEVEEVIGTLGQTFVGLTFNCARCHDHKFDPITQVEYYRLSSSISGLGVGERDIVKPDEQAKFDELDQQLTMVKKKLAALEEEVRARVFSNQNVDSFGPANDSPKPISLWEFDHDLNDSAGGLSGTAQGTAHLENGALVLDGASFVETGPIRMDIGEKTLEAWVRLDDLEQQGGAAITLTSLDGRVFDAIVFAEQEPKRWMSGSDGFQRTESFGGSEETEANHRPVHLAIVYQHGGTTVAYRDGKPYGHSVRKSAVQRFPMEGAQILFGLHHKTAGDNRLLKGRIHRAALYDRALTAEEVAASAERDTGFVTEGQLVAAMDASERDRRDALKTRLAGLTPIRDAQSKRVVHKVYSLVPGPGETTNVLLRGDPDSPGSVVTPGTTAAIAGLSSDFSLTPDAPESTRRRKLTEWLTHPANPLFTRVIVNRVWHYHFGAGIVDTPSDFGFNSGRPSHPELLDYLALQFQRGGYRLKSLHRLIVNSATYRQSANGLPQDQWQSANSQDTSNRLLWRGTARRLEAETLRDAMLMTSGQLNLEAGGPSFKDVSIIDTGNGTTYYEPLDVDGPTYFRRTVYRLNPRGDRSALLDTFDCPDSSVTTPSRSSTTTPMQSLSLMNNSLVLQLSDYFAERVRREAGDDISAQVTRAWQMAVARDPQQTERQLSKALVEEHGLPALCRGLFNFNEFVLIQ